MTQLFARFRACLWLSGLTGALAEPAAAQFPATITPLTALNSNAATDMGDDERPRLATDGRGTWVAVWESDEDLGGMIDNDLDIFFSRSIDNGATWSAPAVINTNADTDSEDDQAPQIAADGVGRWVVVWHSDEDIGGMTGGDFEILFARSSNNGVNWTDPVAVNNASSDSGDDFDPQVATDRNGHWVVIWRSDEDLGGLIDNDFDVLVASSNDDGANWDVTGVVNSYASIDSHDEFEPALAADGLGNWVALWHSRHDLNGMIGNDEDLLAVRSTDNGLTWSAAVVVNSYATVDLHDEFEPQVATDGDGKWVAVWRSGHNLGGTIGFDDDLFVARSTDGGATWSDAVVVNSNAAIDMSDDLHPQIAADRMGNWVVLWYSNPNLGGMTGFDDDLFVSHSANAGSTWTPIQAFNADASLAPAANDLSPSLATDGWGNWRAAWNSQGKPGLGNDEDIFRAGFALPDCNGNGVGDGQDIADGASADCDNNGVPDECEPDGDGDGAIDGCDECPADMAKVAAGACGCNTPDTDANANGTLDCLEPQPAGQPGGCCAAGVIPTIGLFVPALLIGFRALRRHRGRRSKV